MTRKLWTGEEGSHHGNHYTVENATLYTLPDEMPPICLSAYGPRTARAADVGDGFWSMGPQDAIEVWADNGCDGPRFCQLQACVADSEDEAVATAYEMCPIPRCRGS